MYIDNPRKVDKTVDSYICYTMDGTDVTEQLTRRYSLTNKQIFHL